MDLKMSYERIISYFGDEVGTSLHGRRRGRCKTRLWRKARCAARVGEARKGRPKSVAEPLLDFAVSAFKRTHQ